MTPTLEQILNAVSVETGISIEDIQGRSREANVSTARQVFFLVARQRTPYSYREIGEEVGRDHATVLYSYKKLRYHRYTTPKEQGIIRGVESLLDSPIVEVTYLETALLGRAYKASDGVEFRWAIEALNNQRLG